MMILLSMMMVVVNINNLSLVIISKQLKLYLVNLLVVLQHVQMVMMILQIWVVWIPMLVIMMQMQIQTTEVVITRTQKLVTIPLIIE